MQVSLACRATGARPPAKIQWFRNNVAFNLPEGESHDEEEKGNDHDHDDHDDDEEEGYDNGDYEDDGNGVEDHGADERRMRSPLNGPGIMSLSIWLKVMNREQ